MAYTGIMKSLNNYEVYDEVARTSIETLGNTINESTFRMDATPTMIPNGTDLATLGVGDYYCGSKGSLPDGNNPGTGALSIIGSPVAGSYRLLVCKRTNNANYHTLIAWGNDGKLYISQKTGTAAGQSLSWTSTVNNVDVASAASLNAVQGNVTTLQGSVSTLQSNVASLQGNMSTVQSDMTAVQADIASLKAKEYVLASGLTAEEVYVGTVNAANNTNSGNTNFYYTQYYCVAPYERIILDRIYGSGGDVGMVFVDGNLDNPTVISGYQVGNMPGYSPEHHIEVDVPEGAVFFRTTVRSNQLSGLTISGIMDAQKLIHDMVISNTGVSEQPCDEIIRDGGFVRIFPNIGVVGDSLASGAMSMPNDGTVAEDQEITNDVLWWSWIQYMARTCGNTGHNFSKGGMRASSLRVANRSNPLIQAVWRKLTGLDENGVDQGDAEKCELYFIALGHNDRNRANTAGENYPVSAENDVDLTNEENNLDTYRGNYAYVIQKIKKVQPKAIIACLTMKVESVFHEYNEVIRQMPAMFNEEGKLARVFVLDMAQYAPQLNPNTEYSYGHGNTVGYLNYSWQVASYMDWIIRKNPEVFRYVQFIGTDIGPA